MKNQPEPAWGEYSCSECGVNVWGKSDLLLRCDDCDNAMDEY